MLLDAKIKISRPLGILLRNALPVIDGKGAWRDNRMIERLWRSLKYECVYLNAFETGSEMRAGIGKWLNYYTQSAPIRPTAYWPPMRPMTAKQNQ